MWQGMCRTIFITFIDYMDHLLAFFIESYLKTTVALKQVGWLFSNRPLYIQIYITFITIQLCMQVKKNTLSIYVHMCT